MTDTEASVAAAIAAWVERLLPDAQRARLLAEALRDGLGDDPISALGCRRIEEICHAHSRHLTLTFHPDGDLVPDHDRPTGWPPPDGPAIVRRGGGVTSVVRDNDLAIVRVDSLEPWEFAGPFVEAAIALTRGSPAVVLDLRHNGGGEMDTLARLAGFVLGAPDRPLLEVTSHEGVVSWRTPSRETPPRPSAVLVSERTYSSAEALAYVLQNRGIPVIGQKTPGAADHCAPTRVSRFVEALIPYAVVRDPLTGGNWEGRGVVPDILVPPGADHDLLGSVAMPSSNA